AVALNTLLNYLLIFGKFGLPAMGTGGAGLASLIARLVEMGIYIFVLVAGQHYFNLDPRAIRNLNRNHLRQAAGKCLPLMGMELLWSVGMTVLFWSYCQVDEQVVASLAIVETTANLNFIVYGGTSVAVSVMVGARLGAGKFDEARNNAHRILLLGVIVTALYGLLIFLLSSRIPLLFQVTPEIRSLASSMLRINSVYYGLITLNVIFFYTLRIGGDDRAFLVMESGFVWLFLIPLALIFGLLIKPDIAVFYLILQSAELVKALLGRHYFKAGRWIRNLT
ncbi:MAG: MATE family efflux transporter, partial [Bacillota bacterium]|nr:MATE family efflux transporter [Bacillota bacterium]